MYNNKTFKLKFLSLLLIVLLAGCSTNAEQSGVTIDDKIKIGIMLSDVGLGDQSFSDAAFFGLERARDELGIIFDYRELEETGDYAVGLRELAQADNDLVIGLGFLVKEDIETIAAEFPDVNFLLVDDISELPNITSLTFKEDEGSYLAGIVAGMKTSTNTVGFIGGADVPLIHKFEHGFTKGVKAINPEATVVVEYANDFGNDELGKEIANDMIDQDADVLYAAAGFTGVGMIEEAQRQGIYAIGVDSDQYFLGEKAVITSMLKNIDVAIYLTIASFVEEKQLTERHIEMGLTENGVGLAPIRVTSLSKEEEAQLEQLRMNMIEEKK
ncbi:BMP family ABC transporter substrate-binding protein [Alkalihalobacillus sp. LMS39]|uniref:BMP family lipoprotein n=1 Tax=Alkalihalobacillus sp. LMS39 TaxID=2924032 RepID=UPI001FB21C72|nr:BMP family ABC transporter substrate-binding protein [Alkalihalobacillus sp. LMS39]UOE92513.1 BMP family ABC transporter substrate-binding protein [Alkalihalobacillus sp. LMS39]